MSMHRYLRVVPAVIFSAALGCGGGAGGGAPDAARPDGAATDVAPADVAPTDVVPTDVAPTDVVPPDGALTDSAPPDAEEMVCAGDRWGGSADMIAAIVGCTVITGNLSITGNQLLTAELPRLTRVDGFLTVWGNPLLSRAAFARLERVGGYLEVSFNTALTSLELPALVSVNERKVVMNNDVVIRDNALPACQTDAIRAQLAAHDIRERVIIVDDGGSCPP